MEKEVIRKQNINCELTVKHLNTEVNQERRNKKLWQIIGISGIAAVLTTTVLYITKP